MLSREDFYMIKQMRQQGAYIVDIAAQIGCSERTVRRYLKYPEPPARKTRHKMVKLKPFMDYIDMRPAENVWNSEVIFAEIKAMGYTGGRSMLRYYIQPKRKMRPSKEQGESYRLKEKRKAGVLTKNTTPISDDEMVQSGQHQ
uniref:HTH IS21-type domain-containing protein n=1 Tax=Escherichia coli TaxID=562 RepID=A0A811APS0_ECOLX|nr:hypothetical protein [Escherichia coli]